jgi:general secretion pathway protein L
MGRLVGIDIRETHVRAALLHTSYKKIVVERLLELSLESASSLEQAIAAVALPLAQAGESIAVALEGEHAFIHRLTLPTTATGPGTASTSESTARLASGKGPTPTRSG